MRRKDGKGYAKRDCLVDCPNSKKLVDGKRLGQQAAPEAVPVLKGDEFHGVGVKMSRPVWLIALLRTTVRARTTVALQGLDPSVLQGTCMLSPIWCDCLIF